MFAGTQEIFVLIIIAVLLFVLPRLFSRNQSGRPAERTLSQSISTLSGGMRVAIIASLLWPILVAAYLKPWISATIDTAFYVGVGPVILGWSIRWVIAGFRKHRG